MLSTTEARGPFAGHGGHRLVRDRTMPIRVTLQYYGVTDTADLSADVVDSIARSVNSLYDAAAPWNRGSLVVGPGAGAASGRVTAHTSTATFASSVAGGGAGGPAPAWFWGFRR